MQAARDANGSQVANPAKFPQGFKAVADYIHSLGLKSGLYTAKGPRTCAGFAASCQHEVQDAAQWAACECPRPIPDPTLTQRPRTPQTHPNRNPTPPAHPNPNRHR